MRNTEHCEQHESSPAACHNPLWQNVWQKDWLVWIEKLFIYFHKIQLMQSVGISSFTGAYLFMQPY